MELVPWSNCEAGAPAAELVPWSNCDAACAGVAGAVVAGRAIATTAITAMATRTAPRASPSWRRSGAVETVRGAADISGTSLGAGPAPVLGPVDRRLRDVPHARLAPHPRHRAHAYRRTAALPQSRHRPPGGALRARVGNGGVEGRRVRDPLCGDVRIGACGHVRGAPRLTAPREEVAALLGQLPGDRVADVGTTLEVQREPEHPTVPADAHRARPVARPQLLGRHGRVLQLQRRSQLAVAREPDLHLGDVGRAARLHRHPRHEEPVRPLARDDLAAGVPLELEPSPDVEVAGDRQEPAADALGVRDGVPDILDPGVERAPEPDGTAVARRDVPGVQLALHG